MRAWTWPLWLLLWTATLASAGEAPRPRLCVEYVPAIVYEDEPISACVRIEGGQGEPSALKLIASLADASGRELAAAEGKGSAAAPWRRQAEVRLERGSPARLDLRLFQTGTALPVATVTLRVLSARSPLPPLKADGMGLADEAGQRVLVRIEHRVFERDQTWPLFRWLHYKMYGDGWVFRRALILGEDLGAPRDGYLAQTAALLKGVAATVVAVESASADPAPPVFRAVAALASAKLEAAPEAALVSLGHSDPDCGTDVRQFGLALELVVQQLEARGCKHFVFATPVGPSHLTKRLAPYAKAIGRVAFTYQARRCDLQRHLSDESWAEGGREARLVLRYPNAGGQRAMAEALAAFLARCRR